MSTLKNQEAVFCTKSTERLRHKPTSLERFPCRGHLVPLFLKCANPDLRHPDDADSILPIKQERMYYAYYRITSLLGRLFT